MLADEWLEFALACDKFTGSVHHDVRVVQVATGICNRSRASSNVGERKRGVSGDTSDRRESVRGNLESGEIEVMSGRVGSWPTGSWQKARVAKARLAAGVGRKKPRRSSCRHTSKSARVCMCVGRETNTRNHKYLNAHRLVQSIPRQSQHPAP